MDKEKEMLELLSNILIDKVLSLEGLGVKADKKKAENIVVNIGMYLAKKNKDIISK